MNILLSGEILSFQDNSGKWIEVGELKDRHLILKFGIKGDYYIITKAILERNLFDTVEFVIDNESFTLMKDHVQGEPLKNNPNYFRISHDDIQHYGIKS